MNQLVCIKVGGSLITDKSQFATPKSENIAIFAENLSAVLKSFPAADVLLGNGAGSFGHHSAHKYGLKDGAATAEQFYGVGITHNAVRELNLLVGNALTVRGIPAYCLSPGDLFTAKNGEVIGANESVVPELLRHGAIPLIHGDTVLDAERGVSIFSTEKSLFWLAQALRSRYDRITIIMVMNTNGVLDEKGEVIRELRRDAPIAAVQKIPGVKDVTGGIVHKVAMCRQAADWADNVYIIGNAVDDLANAFKGKPAGTIIL